MEKMPRVLIGSPTYEGKEYCRKAFVQNVKNLSYPHTFIMVDNSRNTSYAAKLRRDGVNVVRVPRGRNSRDALANASNYLRKRAIDGGYDFLFMLESDVFPERDIIEQLLKHADTDSPVLRQGKRVVGAPYHIGLNQKRLCVFMPKTNETTGLGGTEALKPGDESWFLQKGLTRVHGMGVGCTLIHRTILEAFPFWYSELDDDRMQNMEIRKHPDTYFYLDLQNNQIPVFCDTDLYAKHFPSDWRKVRDQ